MFSVTRLSIKKAMGVVQADAEAICEMITGGCHSLKRTTSRIVSMLMHQHVVVVKVVTVCP